jgi:quinoprotein glucose dehydrogenase
MRTTPLLLILVLAAACMKVSRTRSDADLDWPVTGGEPGNSRYSPLAQIDRSNVRQLRVAWVHKTGDASSEGRTQIQATPIVVHGVLYATSPTLQVFALRAGTGEELWRFDPWVGRRAESHVNRGVAFWEEGNDRRIFVTAGARLYALDAASGQPILGFGTEGWVDLKAGLGRDVSRDYVIATSPGVVYGDLLIQGTRVSESEGAAPGHVRAYDVRTGRVRWTFHTIPQPGEYGHETWPVDAWRSAGGANSWMGMSVDVARGLVFVPTGSTTPDFYGGARAGQNLFGNSLVALDAATGKRVWHFQTVHHDIWDRDLPAAPHLVTVTHDGRRVDAVAQITKTGFIYVFDRATGAPLFPVHERPVPASTLIGERAWPTQPEPVKPAPIGRQRFTEADITDRTPEAHAAVLARFRTLRGGDEMWTPPSVEGTIIFPEYDGAGKWGGAAVDRETGVLYVNSADIPCIATMAPAATPVAGATPRSGHAVYASTCASCHGADRRGDRDRSPSLVDVGARLSAATVRDVIDRGRGFMPAFATLPDAERRAVADYLLGRDTLRVITGAGAGGGGSPHANEPAAPAGRAASPYKFTGYERWKDADGYPAVKPPWGTLAAIDLNTGERLWTVTLGEFPELTEKGVPPTGTPSYGGPIVTAGGLVLIAATQDERIRAFDKRTGALLWEAPLPAAGYATPSTYMVDGKQYLVIAAGGGKLGTKSGDAYVAFALP